MNKDQQSRKVGTGYVIGRSAFSKISAIEGIFLTNEMRKDFKIFEQKGLSAQSRRDAISKKYVR